MEDLAKEIGKKQEKIEEMNRINKKTHVKPDYVFRKTLRLK